MLENALAKVAREEQCVGMVGCDRRQENKLGGAKVLRFINDDRAKRLVGPSRIICRYPAIDTGTREQPLCFKRRCNPAKDRPEPLALRAMTL